MMHRLAQNCIDRIASPGMDDNEKAVCVYGMELALYTLLSTAGLFMIGMLLGRSKDTILLVAVLYTNQTIGGGYHADTHLRCFLNMAASLCVGLLLVRVPLDSIFFCLLGLFCCGILYLIPLTLHPNKAHLKGKKMILIRWSRILTVVEAALCTVLYILRSGQLNAFVVGLLLCAISRTAAKRIYLDI